MKLEVLGSTVVLCTLPVETMGSETIATFSFLGVSPTLYIIIMYGAALFFYALLGRVHAFVEQGYRLLYDIVPL